MYAPQITAVDVLRQAIAETLSIDAHGLQPAIGQLVVATSAEGVILPSCVQKEVK